MIAVLFDNWREERESRSDELVDPCSLSGRQRRGGRRLDRTGVV